MLVLEPKFYNNNNVSVFDCDGTLVLYKNYRTSGAGKVEFDYGDEKFYLTPHKMHISFLKHCHNRGDLVIVWSKNSSCWAKQIIDKLELTKYVNIVMCKPNRFIDDKVDIAEIIGHRIFLEDLENE